MATHHGQIKNAVLRYLGEHVGEMVHSSDISQVSGFTTRQVGHSVYQMRRTNKQLRDEITVYQGGHTFIYRPGPKQAPEPEPAPARTEPEPVDNQPLSKVDPNMLYEQVGATGKGTVIVRSIDGSLFKLVELGE